MNRGRCLVKVLVACVIAARAVVVGARPAPVLEVTAPPELAPVAATVQHLAQDDFSDILTLTGTMGFMRPITVVLIAEDHPVAAETPRWVSGYARGDRRTVVLFPARVPSYPDRNMRALLRHEIAHVMVWEAAGGQHVPRWLNEGIATVAAREWGIEDRARYAAAVIGNAPKTTRQLDRAFSGSAADVRRAYALSSAFVRFLQNEYGAFTPADLLHGLRGGDGIDAAFRQATGRDLRTVERRFFREQAFWNTWFPFLTSSAALWMVVTALALVAFARRRARSRAMREQWETEDVSPPVLTDTSDDEAVVN